MANLIRVENLKVHFESRYGFLKSKKHVVKAVDDISFDIEKGQTVGLVGESGSGKSTTGRAIAKLVPITDGSIKYEGSTLSSMSESSYYPYRKKIQMIFQDPFGSLNPRMKIGDSVAEPLTVHHKHLSYCDRQEKVAFYLNKVGLSADMMKRFPHEFSGGQRQRIGIARALACEPEFIICDEPVSALDVSVQAQIVNLLKDLQEEFKLTYLFIAHDLAVVEHMSDHIVVMNQGNMVESGPSDFICQQPKHPYTKKLISSIPAI